MRMRARAGLLGALGGAVLVPSAAWAWLDGRRGGGDAPDDTGADAAPGDLRARDPKATDAARRVYAHLTGLEDAARKGRPGRTVIGQHVELQNERYNAAYGDYRGTKQPGYYYRKARDITGALPGFVELDLGPGYDEPGWAVGEARSYSRAWPACRERWGYVDDVVDLAVGVWAGVPRAADGSYHPDGRHLDCASGTEVVLPDNGGRPAGLVGLSFHQPYPGSPVKGYTRTLHVHSPAAGDDGWFGRVVTAGTEEHTALLGDLSFLADHLGYLAAHGVPVLLRPYHEMNTRPGHGFWWSGQDPALYRRLWRIAYDYLVHRRALHNLIFVWSPSAWDGVHWVDPEAYYPGGDHVDVVGVDNYADTPQQPYGDLGWTGVWHQGLKRYGRPRVLAESRYVPLGAGRPDTLDRTPWVMWTVWGQSLTWDNVSGHTHLNTAADVQESYGSPRIASSRTLSQAKIFDR